MNERALEVDNLVKRFGETLAVDGVSFTLAPGRLLALLGPSGSGKTTTLRLLAGFEEPDAGRIRVGGEDVTALSPVARRFGMVFQHFALFPHLDVGENVAFGLQSQGVRGEALHRRVAEALTLVELGGYERRRIAQLSGGQQQRVALARALAPEPRLLLLDEPLSNLDPALRERTRRELRQLLHRIGITTVLVTHEQEEAFDLADVVAVMRDGHLEQLGTPDELYDAPASPFVARFIGRSAELAVQVLGVEESGMRLGVGTGEWQMPRPAGTVPPTGAARLLLRPEALRFVPPADAALAGDIVARRYTGALAFWTVQLANDTTLEVSAPPSAARIGDRVGLAPSGGGFHLYAP